MKERGISFNTEMVRAILAGSKTQTRRVIKPQPNQVFENIAILYTPQDEELGRLGKVLNCQYGEIGERLWVKETHGFVTYDKNDMVETDVVYLSDGDFESDELDGGKWIPSSKMHRFSSRIMLEITGVRVERLQDISQSDAIAEGGPRSHQSIDQVSRELGYADFSRSWFAQLWEEIYGAGSWAKNEWVWVIEFKRIEV